MYETILVPHGGTEAGDKALNQAIRIAKCESSRIVLLHVLEPWPDPSFGIVPEISNKEQIETIFSNLEESTRKFLAERVAQCVKDDIECDGIFRVGKPAEAIIKYATEEKIDLIVMGKTKKIKLSHNLKTGECQASVSKIKSSSKDTITAVVVERGGMTKVVKDLESKITEVKEKMKVEKSNLGKILKETPQPADFSNKVSEITDKIVKLRMDLKNVQEQYHRTLYLLYN